MKYADVAEALCRELGRRAGLKSFCCLKKSWTDSAGRQWWTAFFQVGGLDVHQGSDPDPDLAWKAALSGYCRESVAPLGNLPVRAESVEELALKLAAEGSGAWERGNRGRE